MLPHIYLQFHKYYFFKSFEMFNSVLLIINTSNIFKLQTVKDWTGTWIYLYILASYPLDLVVHGAMDCRQKSFKLMWWCHQLLSRFLGNGPLPQVPCQSANEKDDNEMIPGNLLAFTLQLKKNLPTGLPRKVQDSSLNISLVWSLPFFFF